MRSLDQVGEPRRSAHAAAYDRWDPDQRRTNGGSIAISRTGDRLGEPCRPTPSVLQPRASWHGDPSPWLAVGITVLGTIIGFFVVYRWPASSKPHAVPPASVREPGSPPPSAAEARLESGPAVR